MARRTWRDISDETKPDSDHSPSPAKFISPTRPYSIKEEPGIESMLVDPSESSKDVKNKEVHTERDSVINLSASPSLQKMQPAVTAASSDAVASETTQSPEGTSSRAALQKDDRGLWERLRSGKRRNGGREYSV
jgi:hypothetical protein